MSKKKKTDLDSLPLEEQVAQLKRSNSSYRSRNTKLSEDLEVLSDEFEHLKKEHEKKEQSWKEKLQYQKNLLEAQKEDLDLLKKENVSLREKLIQGDEPKKKKSLWERIFG